MNYSGMLMIIIDFTLSQQNHSELIFHCSPERKMYLILPGLDNDVLCLVLVDQQMSTLIAGGKMITRFEHFFNVFITSDRQSSSLSCMKIGALL